MKKLFYAVLFLAIIVMTFSCKSTYIKFGSKDANYIPYYLEVQKADSLFLTNNFERSYQILDSVFKIYKPLNTDMYSEYGIYVGAGVMAGHFENIEQKVRYGIKNFGNIDVNHEYWIAITSSVTAAAHLSKNEIALLEKQYMMNINLKLRDELVLMYRNDQKARNSNDFLGDMNIVDLENLAKLQNIIRNYGFPSKSIIGSNNAFNSNENFFSIEVLLLHQPTSIKIELLPLILENVINGNCDPNVYAIVTDRMTVEKENLQLYGSYSFENNNGNRKLKFPEKTNELRRSIGLPPLGYEEWRVNSFRKTE